MYAKETYSDYIFGKFKGNLKTRPGKVSRVGDIIKSFIFGFGANWHFFIVISTM